LKNRDNNSGGISNDQGSRPVHNSTHKCSGSESRRWSVRVPTSDAARPSRQPDGNRRTNSVDFNLSTEEQRIVALIVAGYTSKDLAVHFSLSQSTIYRRTTRIIGKLGVCNKFELLLFVMSHQLLGGLLE
jgi:DNA-binding NarL/FixJ family response regulator